MSLPDLVDDIALIPDYRRFGRVAGVSGMLIEVGGLSQRLTIGGHCTVVAQEGRRLTCEVVGFRHNRALLMPFGALDGVGLGCKVELADRPAAVYPDDGWLGRVVNALGEPIDGKGPLPRGPRAYPLRNQAPPAHARKRVQGKIDLGIRALNTFLTCCRGQRMGIFSGSGVGKSVLLSMIARYTTADATVIGLVGERGREVQEFLEDDLGPEGLKRSIVVVATSDESPLMRRQAAYLTLAIAEYLRDRDRDVLCLIDSITRFAMAQREIGLSAGEPPTTKGYTPTVFAELPRLLERAGPGDRQRHHHRALQRAGGGRRPQRADRRRGARHSRRPYHARPHHRRARPLSRDQCAALDLAHHAGLQQRGENAVVSAARQFISTYEDMAELIRLGAYKRGSDAKVDEAIRRYPLIEAFLAQPKQERADLGSGYAQLTALLKAPVT